MIASRHQILLSAISLGLCVIALVSHAHRSHFGWTDIQLRDGFLQVEHRFHEHDVARLLGRLAGAEVDVTETRNQARFALYVEQHFELEVDAQRAALELVGAELSGAYVFVYQQVPVESRPTKLTLDADPLMELYDDQLHLVNISIHGQAVTLEFSKDSEPQAVRF